jgi:hypothetical protein
MGIRCDQCAALVPWDRQPVHEACQEKTVKLAGPAGESGNDKVGSYRAGSDKLRKRLVVAPRAPVYSSARQPADGRSPVKALRDEVVAESPPAGTHYESVSNISVSCEPDDGM